MGGRIRAVPSPFCLLPSAFPAQLMNPAQHALILAVRLYRCTLSPALTFLFGPLSQCRFTPSCSAYALEAIRIHGAFQGSWLALRRLGRCHPWGDCGHDPVPERKCAVPGVKCQGDGAVVRFGGARLLTNRLARTLAPPAPAECTTAGGSVPHPLSRDPYRASGTQRPASRIPRELHS
jgi:putative membrane protein insertion efficiency factor